MTGAPDPLYVKVREVLVDALEALGPHRASLVLVGAQAIESDDTIKASCAAPTQDLLAGLARDSLGTDG